MTVSDYTYLLARPDAINDRRTKELEAVIEQFPYFQSARALRLKGLYNQNSFQYNQALKTTAAHTTERSVLFDFITSDSFTAIHKGLYEEKLAALHAIDVNGSEIVAPMAKPDLTVNKVEQSILTSIREAEAAARQDVTFEVVSPDDTAALYALIDEAEDETATTTEGAQPVADNIGDDAEGSEVSANTDVPELDEPPHNPTSEEKLGLGRPLEFSRDERHSFFEWLQLSKFQPIVRDEPHPEDESPEQEDDTEVAAADESTDTEPGEITAADLDDHLESEDSKDNKLALIDKFIEANPKIPPVRQDLNPQPIPEAAVDSVELMTETLARVYLEQRKYTKAIQAYEILILKYPEKSSFFADRISEIKNLQQNNLIQ